MRLRVTAPENTGTVDIENSTEGAAVYKVPPYWYTGCQHGPTVHCPVERGGLAIAIFVRNKGLQLAPEKRGGATETSRLGAHCFEMRRVQRGAPCTKRAAGCGHVGNSRDALARL